MGAIVYVLGIVYISIGSCLILYTRTILDWFNGLLQAYKLKYLSAITVLFGLLFLISASATIYPWVFRIIGILAFGEAVLAFTDPQKIYSRIIDWYLNLSEQTHRLFGIICVIFGTAILTWVK